LLKILVFERGSFGIAGFHLEKEVEVGLVDWQGMADPS